MNSFYFKKIWCLNAINLDAWWNTSMVYNNEYKKWPWRNIVDAFIIVEDNWLWDKVLEKKLNESYKKIELSINKIESFAQRSYYFRVLDQKINILIKKTKSSKQIKILKYIQELNKVNL